MVELEGETDPLQIAMKELKYVFPYFLAHLIHAQGKLLHTCYISHCEIKSHRIWPI